MYSTTVVSPRLFTVDPMLLPSGNPLKCHEDFCLCNLRSLIGWILLILIRRLKVKIRSVSSLDRRAVIHRDSVSFQELSSASV